MVEARRRMPVEGGAPAPPPGLDGPPGWLLLISILAGCSGGDGPPVRSWGDGEAGALRPLRGRVEAPHAAAVAGGVLAAWGAVAPDGSADIVARWRGGSGWEGPPVRVNPRPGTAVAGRQVGPRAAVTSAGRILIAWVDQARGPEGEVVLAASEDRGRSFLSPVAAGGARTAARRGAQEYHDLAVLAGGRVAVVWLDERGAPSDDLNQKQVYAAFSQDAGRSFQPAVRVTSSPQGVCPCCRPGIAAGPDGALHVIYRDRTGDELVVAVASLLPGAESPASPVKIGRGSWRNRACPVDGPALIAGPGARLRAVWMDGSSGREALWQSRSEDGGRSFDPPSAVAVAGAEESLPGRAAAALHPRLGAVAAWEDDAGRVWARLLEGRGPPVLVAGSEGAAARSPAIAIQGEDIHCFWVESSWDGDAIALEGAPASRLRHALLELTAPPE